MRIRPWHVQVGIQGIKCLLGWRRPSLDSSFHHHRNNVKTLSGSKFHSLEARKAKVRLPELVLALGSFRFLVDPRVLMLCTLLKGNIKSDV